MDNTECRLYTIIVYSFLCITFVCAQRDRQLTVETQPTATTYLAQPTFHFVTYPSNTTALAEHELKLTCAVSGATQVRVNWQILERKLLRQKNLQRTGRNYRIVRDGPNRQQAHLEFSRLLVSDSGYYRCVAKANGQTIQTDYFYLTIQAAVAIPDPPPHSRRIVDVGTRVVLRCRAMAVPPPIITWYKNGKLLPNTTFYEERRRLRSYSLRPDSVPGVHPISSNLTFLATESAEYTCRAQNTHYFGVNVTSVNISVIVREEENNNVGPFCTTYNGTVCLPYIGSDHVYYEESDISTVWSRNEDIVSALIEEMVSTFDPFCRRPAMKMLCRYAFPQCDLETMEPMPLCRENCMAVQDMFCFDEWRMLMYNKAQNLTLRHRGHFRLPNCSTLPWEDSGQCAPVDLFHVTPESVTSTCYFGDGRYYNGTQNTTQSGLACQPWSTFTPHIHTRYVHVYPLLEHAGNACRNPGGEETQPWCYTAENHTRWQRCDVSKCNGDVQEQIRSLGSLFSLETVIIIILICLLLLCIILLIACIGYKMIHSKDTSSIHYNTTPTDDIDVDIEKIPDNEFYIATVDSVTDCRLTEINYSRNDIVYMCDIGCGAFGRVFKGMAPNIVDKNVSTIVAVKMLKDEVSEEMLQDFEREACLMTDLSHPNILQLLGVCVTGRPMCLLFEFMNHGDLNVYLRNCSSPHFIQRRRSNDSLTYDNPKLSYLEQLHICHQIASGMVYLSERNYIHRDLATRNCLVSDNLCVKLSDFGLTRKLESDFYKGLENEAIAIRWMPLEAISNNMFTVSSDVWSFGVVLWEVFSFALQPYYGLTHEQVIHYIKDGKILSIPDNTPAEVYEIMKLCWAFVPEERPLFLSLHNALQQMLKVKLKQKTSQPITSQIYINSV